MAALGVASAAATLLSEHRLRLVLRPDGHGLTRVEPLPRRPSQAHRMLIGRNAQQALALLPNLVPVSGKAHRAAAAAALGTLQPDHGRNVWIDQRPLLLERLHEHLLPLHRDWPLCMAQAPSQSTLQDIDSMARALDAPRAEPQALAALRELVESRSLGMPARDFLQIDSADALLRWAREHDTLTPARFIAWLADQPLALAAAALPPPLGTPPPGEFAARLLGDPTGSFQSDPQWHGSCRETGPWARLHQRALLRDLAGDGAPAAAPLVARFAARLLELAETLMAWMGEADMPPTMKAAAGLGLADTARGLLAYGVELDHGERIARCLILAPAQWNFHPQGTAAQLLRSIAWTTPRQVAQTASLVACAVDPFVRCDFALPGVAPGGVSAGG